MTRNAGAFVRTVEAAALRTLRLTTPAGGLGILGGLQRGLFAKRTGAGRHPDVGAAARAERLPLRAVVLFAATFAASFVTTIVALGIETA